jgi:hypothetical protein
MPSNITVYNIYKKGLKTFSGSFPIYDQTVVAGCNVISQIANQTQVASSLAELDESASLKYLIIPPDPNKYIETNPNIRLTINVNVQDYDPYKSGILTYDQLIIN